VAFTYRYLKHEVTGPAIHEFIKLNREFVQAIPDKEVNTDEGAVDNIDNILTKMQALDFGFVEFDDQFEEKQLVYAITVNRTDKRITVFFRGSVTNGRDWTTNGNALFKTLDRPDEIKEGVLNDKIKVHRGFYSYLNERLDKTTHRRLSPLKRLLGLFIKPEDDTFVTKFENIEAILLDLLEKHKDYKIYCSGHSLGGALSQLLAYQLAGYGSLKKFKNACPVTAVTFASPNVGDAGFNKAYQRLEKRGLLRHTRVSNAGDVVPVSVPGFGYTQTSVHLHVSKDSTMEVDYGSPKTVRSQLAHAWKKGSGLSKLKDDILGHHTPGEYYNNLMYPTNDDMFMTSSVEELYDAHAGNFTN
jgi:hypothetical protein